MGIFWSRERVGIPVNPSDKVTTHGIKRSSSSNDVSRDRTKETEYRSASAPPECHTSENNGILTPRAPPSIAGDKDETFRGILTPRSLPSIAEDKDETYRRDTNEKTAVPPKQQHPVITVTPLSNVETISPRKLPSDVQLNAASNYSERLKNICLGQNVDPDTELSEDLFPRGFLDNMRFVESFVMNLQQELSLLTEEKTLFQIRLSKFAGAALTDNNPNITDLNDPKRPSKLSEMLDEIYNEEWSDAMEAISKKKNMNKTEQEIIYHLYCIIVIIYKVCLIKARLQELHYLLLPASASEDEILDRWKRLKVDKQDFMDTRKRAAPNMIAFLQKSLSTDDMYHGEIQKCSPKLDCNLVKMIRKQDYFRKCVEICWHFVICDPPVFLDINALVDGTIDKNVHKLYTQSGSRVHYIVWPALYLYKDGTLLSKSVVQPYQDDTSVKKDSLSNPLTPVIPKNSSSKIKSKKKIQPEPTLL